MQRRIEQNNRAALWIERIVWNAAAGAVLAVLILVLLGSLRWLDEIAPGAVNDAPPVSAERGPGAQAVEPDRPSALARVNRPSG